MLASVRDWKRANPGEVFFCCRETTPMDKRVSAPGVGYILRAKILNHEKDWTSNTLEDPPAVESDQLRKAAERFGFPQQALPYLAPPDEDPQKKDNARPSSSKKKKGKRKVKEMLEKARWKIEGTPLDPDYRRPIKLGKAKRKKKEFSKQVVERFGDSQVLPTPRTIPMDWGSAFCCCIASISIFSRRFSS